MVGAQGAMQMPPGMLDLANNPETVKEMEFQQDVPGEEASSSLPPVTAEPQGSEEYS
jgi:hypothetical protein